jgi:hypothetical protein
MNLLDHREHVSRILKSTNTLIQPIVHNMDRFESAYIQVHDVCRSHKGHWKLTTNFRHIVKQTLNAVGFDTTHWQRVVMYKTCGEWLQDLGPIELDCTEISASERNDVWRDLNWRTYTELNWPEFDVCEPLDGHQNSADVIIADQVFEHLLWPYRAGKNIHAMLRTGGYALITVPFMIPVHEVPIDCSRWTETGLKYLLAECGFELDEIRTGSWGNRSSVKANLKHWARHGWFRFNKNDSRYPVAVWALARKV